MELIVGNEAPPELHLLAAALARSAERDLILSGKMDDLPMSARTRIVDAGSEVPDSPVLRIRIDGRTANITSRSPSFIVETEAGEWSCPWFLPLRREANHVEAERLRIGIAGGTDARRLRMSWKTLEELRRRRTPLVAILFGDGEISSVTEERPDEVHPGLGPAEYLALLDRIDVVVECTDSFGSESFLAIAARDLGIPVIAHRDRLDLVAHGGQGSPVWSADGFADAVAAAKRIDRRPSDAAAPLQTILDRLEVR